MRNQIKAEIYKLFHSKQYIIAIVVMVAFAALTVLLSSGDGGFYMGFIIDNIDNNPVQFGFMLNFEDKLNPAAWEVIYSAAVMNVLMWIILVSMTVHTFLSEFKDATMKLMVSYGGSRLRIYFSKLFAVNVYYGIIYMIYSIVTVILCSNTRGVTVSGEMIMNSLKLGLLYFLIYIVISCVTALVCLLTRNSIMSTTIVVLYIISLIFVFLITGGSSKNLLVNVYFYINPMYYLMRASAFWAKGEVIKEILIYFCCAFSALSAASCYRLKKMEISFGA